MNTSFFTLAAGLFLLLVAGLFGLVLYGYGRALRRAGTDTATCRTRGRRLAAGLGLWLLVTMGLALSGILANWTALPPRLLLVLVPPLLFTGWLCRSGAVGQWLDHVPPVWLVAPQSFRVLMEIILWLLFRAHVIPVQMTFEGRNFDILVGFTAPLVAYFGLLRGTWPRWVLVAWHVGSLAVLANIVTIAVLSTPLPLRVFWNEPANTVIAHWPFVWLPAFVVPFAYIGHVLALRQVVRQRNQMPIATLA